MSEQAKVGLIVLVAAGLLVATVFYVTGAGLRGQYAHYSVYLKFAGGLEQGAPVRFAGLKVGRVSSVRVSEKDPTSVQIGIEVKKGIPLRSDSVAHIAQLGMLGENYVEIRPGKSPDALPPGSTIPSIETQDLAALMEKMNVLMDQAQPLVADLHTNLNAVSKQLEGLLTDTREVTSPPNRERFAGILKNTDQMLADNRPRIDQIATNFQTASGRIDPLMGDLRTATAKIDKLLSELHEVVGENRKDLQVSIQQLTHTLESTRELVTQLNQSFAYNSGNVDSVMANLRETSQNLKELSDTLKQRPFSLVRVVPKPERQMPGGENSKAKNGRATRSGS